MRSHKVTTPSREFPIQKLLLSDVELADYFGCSVATVRKWRLNGTGPRWRKLGSLVRYSLVDAQAYLASRPSGGGEI
jgi:hypothetical protein